MPARLKHINPDPPNTSVIATCPALLEWLRFVPPEHHAGYCERAGSLLANCNNPQGIGAVLRIMLTERRLATWALQSERVRRNSRAKNREALKEMAAAEKLREVATVLFVNLESIQAVTKDDNLTEQETIAMKKLGALIEQQSAKLFFGFFRC